VHPEAIKFSKMHGLGNDFIVIDSTAQSLQLSTDNISALADRHRGIGFDQLLQIEKSSKADFACRIFNSDGSEAEQCGNGLRCVGRFLYEENLTTKKAFTIATKAGIFDVLIHAIDRIQVSMGAPCFEPERIPFVADNIQKTYILDVNQSALQFSVLSMGNPHAVMEVDSVKTFPVNQLGPMVAAHPAFPQSTNVGFMEILDRTHIRLRTFERGVGETFACGSNACAAVVAGINNNLLDHNVIVILPYGELSIEWQGKSNPVLMTGPATRVFDGLIKIPANIQPGFSEIN
jgi:diaminopimelate epimerase